MSKDARKSVKLTDEAKKKFDECVTALAACGFGEDGPPLDTTFAEIEEFEHEVGRMVARAVDEAGLRWAPSVDVLAVDGEDRVALGNPQAGSCQR